MNEKSNQKQTHSDERELITIGDFSEYSEMNTTETRQIEQHILSSKNRETNDTLLLENLEDLVGDPQIFTIIKFKDEHKIIELKNVAGAKIDPKTKIDFENLIHSDLIYLIEYKKKEKIMFIWDFQYPDCSTLFEIYKITELGIKKVFSDEVVVKEIKSGKTDKSITLKVTKNCGEIEAEIEVKIE